MSAPFSIATFVSLCLSSAVFLLGRRGGWPKRWLGAHMVVVDAFLVVVGLGHKSDIALYGLGVVGVSFQIASTVHIHRTRRRRRYFPPGAKRLAAAWAAASVAVGAPLALLSDSPSFPLNCVLASAVLANLLEWILWTLGDLGSTHVVGLAHIPSSLGKLLDDDVPIAARDFLLAVRAKNRSAAAAMLARDVRPSTFLGPLEGLLSGADIQRVRGLGLGAEVQILTPDGPATVSLDLLDEDGAWRVWGYGFCLDGDRVPGRS